MSMWKSIRFFSMAIAATLLAGCTSRPEHAGGKSDPPTAPAMTSPAAVRIDNFSFAPAVITVPVGGAVTWVNHDDVPHTVTANNKSFGSNALDTDDAFSHTFTAAGTYEYFCAVHPHMTGKVIVK